MPTKKWDEERVATLVGVVGEDMNTEVTHSEVEAAALSLDTSTRSVGAKLRSLGYEVEKVSAVREKTFTEVQENEIKDFLAENSGLYTYAEIATKLFDGKRSSRQVQGKILSMELTDQVKPTDKQEVAKKYTDEEQDVFVKMAEAGAFLEDIADKLGRDLNSIRGKALSLNRQTGLGIPKQRDVAKGKEDLLEGLVDKIGEMTVEEIAASIDRTERGVKYMLTRRGLTASNYDGAKKKAKRDEKAAAAE